MIGVSYHSLQALTSCTSNTAMWWGFSKQSAGGESDEFSSDPWPFSRTEYTNKDITAKFKTQNLHLKNLYFSEN